MAESNGTNGAAPGSDLKNHLFLSANTSKDASPNGQKPGRISAIRRLSARNVTEKDLAFGKSPAVVVPDTLIEKVRAHTDGLSTTSGSDDDDDDVAFSMEQARQQLEGISSITAQPTLHKKTRVTDHYAFAFDIDGVLIRGGEPIPAAVEALKLLNGHNSHGVKVPYIFLTNGGGKTEAERCIQLSKQLQITVSPGQFICGHTPMREMVDTYSTVLVVGGIGERCRIVAEEYGFKDVITPGDIIKTNPSSTPFRKLTAEEHAACKVRDFSKIKIEAIFVFADSRDWAGDQQIILDVLTSEHGVLGTRSKNYDQGPPLYFAHNDILWASEHGSSRIGMGALRRSVEAMYEAVTGKELETIAFGKPQMGTFAFATRLLQQWRRDTHGIDAPPKTVYFVGDTPESDIRGTNQFNSESENTWYSILVRTGVYNENHKLKYQPKVIVDDVLAAVKHGMEREAKKEINMQLTGAPYGSLPPTPMVEIANPEM